MRFMHIADVHLGAAPDHGFPWARDRGREIWESFRRCVEEANKKKADLLLIAGDLFHRPPEVRELREVNYLFSTLDRTVVVLMAGNHDYLSRGSAYLTFPWSENVICLFSPECERVRLPELKTEIYGFSYYRKEIPEPLYDTLTAEPGDYFKILLAHGGDAQHIPINRERLQKSGFDYVALGHIHKPQSLITGMAEYAGALEPIDCNDLGPHGYLLGEVHRGKLRLSFQNFCTREYRREKVAVTEEDTAYSVREKIAGVIRSCGSGNIYRLVLEGQRQPQLNLDSREYLNCGRIVEITDKTIPALHIEELRRRYRGQLIGDYIESFGEAPQGIVEEKALRYGLEALLYCGQ